jgi:hypothetical protein
MERPAKPGGQAQLGRLAQSDWASQARPGRHSKAGIAR